MLPLSDTGTPAATDWVERAIAQRNTAPPTAKTDEIASAEQGNTAHTTVKTDETPTSPPISSVLTVTPAVYEQLSEPEAVTEIPEAPVNPGVLMTLGRYHGYPRLPLKPGVSIAEGATAWRTFTSTADADMLALAADAARATWSDDPMTNDLYYVGPGGDA